jgi:quinol monooxygenase YgiN
MLIVRAPPLRCFANPALQLCGHAKKALHCASKGAFGVVICQERRQNGASLERIYTMVEVGLLVRLEAKPGKESEVESFLKSALPLVDAEPDTVAWFAIKLGPSTFGIFDVFPNEAGRNAHISGKVAEALFAKAGELLAQPPHIEKVDVLATKLPH